MMMLSDIVLEKLQEIQSDLIDAILCVDDGGEKFLQGIGGVGTLMHRFRVSTVVHLDDDGAKTAAQVQRWERERLGPEHSQKDSTKPVKLVFFVADYLWDCEDRFGTVLRMEFSSTWIVAKIFCLVSEVAHGSVKGGKSIDFKKFAMTVQQLGRPNAVELDIRHLAVMNMAVLLDAEGCGMFTMTNKKLEHLFPVTLSQLGLFDENNKEKRDVGDIDGNEDLPASYKGDLKLLARSLASMVHRQLQLDVKSDVWASGFTSRVVGNAMLDYLQELEESSQDLKERRGGGGGGGLFSPRRNKKAKLIIFDRSVDLVSPLCEADIPLSQLVSNSFQKGDNLVKNNNLVESCLGGPLPTTLLGYSNDPVTKPLLESICLETEDAAIKTLGSDFLKCPQHMLRHGNFLEMIPKAISRDPLYLDNLGAYQFIASISLALENAKQLTQYQSLERIILSNPETSHVLLPLIDLLNRERMDLMDILQLALLAYSHVATIAKTSPLFLDKDIEATFVSALRVALSKHEEVTSSLLKGRPVDHVLNVLKEVLVTRQNKNEFKDDPCRSHIGSIVERGFHGQRSPAVPLGESAFQKTTKELENKARNLLKKGFNVFGFGGGQEETTVDSDQHGEHESGSGSPNASSSNAKMKIEDGETCIIFAVGGISFREVFEIYNLASYQGHGNVQFIFGGTTVANPTQTMHQMFSLDLQGNSKVDHSKNRFSQLF